MSKYEFTPKKKSPSKEDISKYKDFAKLVGPVEKAKQRLHRPLYKDPKFFFGIVVVLLILYLVWTQVEIDRRDKELNNSHGSEHVEKP